MSVSVLDAARVVPTSRQVAWQELEFYAFIHFTVNTFTDREWGDGTESPAIFNPGELDAAQWVEVCRSAGMRGLILTCKHHDGFCLWPSRYTEHSVKRSPWREGQGDLVREVADACRQAGLKFGIYVSPWDRHEPSYGDSDTYNTYFVNQLTELLTGYGDLFCVWFDGACGEGPNGKRQLYDWDAYYQTIREHQPDAVISVCGPDVRWCGNEAGHTRKVEWSVVPATLQDNEKIQEKSQQVDDGEFAKRVGTDEEDLGSRDVLARIEQVVWYPAEVNTSIRPGWFYHAHEDEQVKSPEVLFEQYERTVGGNTTFLLNLPPERTGRIHERDAQHMKELGRKIYRTYSHNLDKAGVYTVSSAINADHSAQTLTDGCTQTYWQPLEDDELPRVHWHSEKPVTLNRIMLQEYIRKGQRIEQFLLEYWDGKTWKPLYQGAVVGYKKICRFPEITTNTIRLTILQSRWHPMISHIGFYLAR